MAVTFADYLIPTLDCIPKIECLITEDVLARIICWVLREAARV